MSNAKVLAAHAAVSEALEKLESVFVPGVHLSFVMRHHDNPECYMVVSSDDLGAIIETLEREHVANASESCQPPDAISHERAEVKR